MRRLLNSSLAWLLLAAQPAMTRGHKMQQCNKTLPEVKYLNEKIDTNRIVRINDVSNSTLFSILNATGEIEAIRNALKSNSKNPPLPDDVSLPDKTAVLLFMDKSTRTYGSSIAAANMLKMPYIGYLNAAEDSAIGKGESLADTIRMLENWGDVIVIRQQKDKAGFPLLTSKLVSKKTAVINAGDHPEHPTQTISDVKTLAQLRKLLDAHKLSDHMFKDEQVAFSGNVQQRTIRTLAKLLGRLGVKDMTFISPETLPVDDVLMADLESKKVNVKVSHNLADELPNATLLYMHDTPLGVVPRHRITDFRLTNKLLQTAQKKLRVFHPLPRFAHNDISMRELPEETDSDPRVVHTLQADNLAKVRAAILRLTAISEGAKDEPVLSNDGLECSNGNCVTTQEKSVPQSHFAIGDKLVCRYCDKSTLVASRR